MRRSSILLVEDNPALSTVLSALLRRKYATDQVATLSGAWNYVAEKPEGYDVILLDRILPDGDGLELIPILASEYPQTRICVLSHKDSLQEKLLGLQAGADCYLPKPFDPQELLANVEVLLRRAKRIPTDEWPLGEYRFNERRQQILGPNGQLDLTKRETQFLVAFLKAHEHRVSREQLLDVFWRKQPRNPSSSIHVNIQRLRRRLLPIGAEIRSLYGLGYQLILPKICQAKTV